MLIRWVTKEDINAWMSLANDVSQIFGHPNMAKDSDFQKYMEAKISKYEALIAIDRMSNSCLGIIGYSRNNNRISWLGVTEQERGNGIGSKLLECAINQLDQSKEITVISFREGVLEGIPARKLYQKYGFKDIDDTIIDEFGNPRCKMVLPGTYKSNGGSFHYQYHKYDLKSKKETCPVCTGQVHPNPPALIKELEHSWLECFYEAQGRLFGKCHVLSKKHSVHFYDMNLDDMMNFMSDVQKCAKALHKVTGAVKINYEIHGNSLPHLHVHLFPRYLDDDFPSAPINYHITEPSPYENYEEFKWFLNQMEIELNNNY